MKKPFLFLTLLFLALAGMALYNDMKWADRRVAIDADSETAIATIVHVERSRRINPVNYIVSIQHNVYVSFDTRDGRAVRREKVSIPNSSRASVNQLVKVIYSVRDPRQFYAADRNHNDGLYISGVFGGLTILCFALHIWRSKVRKRLEEEERAVRLKRHESPLSAEVQKEINDQIRDVVDAGMGAQTDIFNQARQAVEDICVRHDVRIPSEFDIREIIRRISNEAE